MISFYLICTSVNSFRFVNKRYSDGNTRTPRDEVRFDYGLGKSFRLAMGMGNVPDLDQYLPRLSEDINSLLSWISNENGFIGAAINKTEEGWSLITKTDTPAGTTLLSIPKKLCLFSNPYGSGAVKMPLLNNTLKLISSLDESQWRIRLAVAMLSERVRPNSFYRSYLRNLPFEFWGVPMFFNSTVFNMIQDLSLMQTTRDRCRFLLEFTDNVLVPLHRTSLDPFLGQSADVNAFGWAFAAASSRALRNPTVVGNTGPVMIPGIDIIQHSFNSNCEIIDVGDTYKVRALVDIPIETELTICYGELSNDELFSDYGFTIENNKYDRVRVNCDAALIETARNVMAQNSNSHIHSNTNNNNNNIIGQNKMVIPLGRGGDKYDPTRFHAWQAIWLQSIGLIGPGASPAVGVGGPDLSLIDPKLWALLRILYTKSETDLLQHGYDPFLLQHYASVTSAETEGHVIRTITGLIAILLHTYPSDWEADAASLRTGILDYDKEGKDNSNVMLEDITSHTHRIIRNAVGLGGSTSSSSSAVADAAINNVPLIATLRKLAAAGAKGFVEEQTESPADAEETSNLSLEDILRKEQLQLTGSGNDLRHGQILSGAVTSSADSYGAKSPGKSKYLVQTISDNMEEERQGIVSTAVIGSSNVVAPMTTLSSQDESYNLPVNVREVLKYRIRKKKMLTALITNLYGLYSKLCPEEPDSFLPPAPPSSGDSKRARIRELLNEVRSRGAGKDESDILGAAARLSSKWAGKGLSL